VTKWRVHETKIARTLNFSVGSIVVLVRYYIDYELAHQRGVLRHPAHVLKERSVPKNRHILQDERVELVGYYARRECPGPLSRIEFWYEVNEQRIFLLINHLGFGATTIAATYKDRWQIEIYLIRSSRT
jgi:hypothetical protein